MGNSTTIKAENVRRQWIPAGYKGLRMQTGAVHKRVDNFPHGLIAVHTEVNFF